MNHYLRQKCQTLFVSSSAWFGSCICYCFLAENVKVSEEDSGGESGEEPPGGGHVWQRNIKPAGYSWTLWVYTELLTNSKFLFVVSVLIKVWVMNLICLHWPVGCYSKLSLFTVTVIWLRQRIGGVITLTSSCSHIIN